MGRDHYNIRALLCAYDPGSFCFVIEKNGMAVTIVTIKIGAGLSSLAYLRIEDEKLFAADNIFLSASIFAHKVGFAVHYFALATVGRSGASIALWHPPAVCGRSLAQMRANPHPLFGRSLAQMRANPHPLFYQRKEKTHGEKTDRANESSYDSRAKVDDI